MPVLPVPRESPVQEDELEEVRATVGVLRESPQPGEGKREGKRSEGAAVSGRILLRRRFLCCLRRLPVSDTETMVYVCHCKAFSERLYLAQA